VGINLLGVNFIAVRGKEELYVCATVVRTILAEVIVPHGEEGVAEVQPVLLRKVCRRMELAKQPGQEHDTRV
jgi:hypothetical protein